MPLAFVGERRRHSPGRPATSGTGRRSAGAVYLCTVLKCRLVRVQMLERKPFDHVGFVNALELLCRAHSDPRNGNVRHITLLDASPWTSDPFALLERSARPPEHS